jgi:hypothetical protein
MFAFFRLYHLALCPKKLALSHDYIGEFVEILSDDSKANRISGSHNNRLHPVFEYISIFTVRFDRICHTPAVC